MYAWGRKSAKNLDTLNGQLIMLCNNIIKDVDCTILYGFRNKREQEELFVAGKTTKHFPHSKHNRYPSKAVDIAPYPIDWYDINRFYYFGGYVIARAKDLDIPIRWGGDWDGDFQVRDQNFDDLVHFELII